MTVAPSRPVRIPKAAELVAAQLRRQIRRSELKEGDALPAESQLMEEFGVSRPTLREAFRVLESEGLLSVRRGVRGGARIHEPNGDASVRYASLVLRHRETTLADVLEARNQLELSLIDLLTSRLSPDDLSQLSEALDRAAEYVDDLEHYQFHYIQFHRLIARLVGNQTLNLLAEIVYQIVYEANRAYVSRFTDHEFIIGQQRRGQKALQRLVAALSSDTPRQAIELWRAHADEVTDMLLGGSNGEPQTVADLLGDG